MEQFDHPATHVDDHFVLVGDGCGSKLGLEPVLSVLGPSFTQHVDVGAPREHGFPASTVRNHLRGQIELVAK